MKRSWILILTLGLLVGLLSGCTDKGNVSEDKDGRITDAPVATLPTEGADGADSLTESTEKHPDGSSEADGHAPNGESGITSTAESDLGDIADDILGDLTESPTDSARTRHHRTRQR